jgi:choline monooxygenase
MFNVYPWGISINVVLPQSVACTRVVYLTYVWDTDLDETGAGAGLHYVEQEDEVVVESCMRGTASPLYERGRYSPRHERGVHHFHRMLVEWMR